MDGSSKYSKYIERAEAHYEQKNTVKNGVSPDKQRLMLIVASCLVAGTGVILGIYYGGLPPFG